MKFSSSWKFIILFLSSASFPVLNATILECKLNNPMANAYCGDYCKSLNQGNHVAGNCAKDEVSCLCEMSNNRTIKMRILQDQEPAPYTSEASVSQATVASPFALHPVVQHSMPPHLQAKHAQRLICDGSQMATTTCNSFCIQAVRGSGGYCNVQDFTCRCKNVQFIKNEPIEAVYLPSQFQLQQQGQHLNENTHPNMHPPPTMGTELNQAQSGILHSQFNPAMTSQAKPHNQFRPPPGNVVSVLAQKPFVTQQQQFHHQQQQPSFYPGSGLQQQSHPFQFNPQFSRPIHHQPFVDGIHGSHFVAPLHQQHPNYNQHYFQQVPQQQMVPLTHANFEPVALPTPTLDMESPVPDTGVPAVSQPEFNHEEIRQANLQNETLPQSLTTEPQNNETIQAEQSPHMAASVNLSPAVEQSPHDNAIELSTEIPELTTLPTLPATTTEQLQATVIRTPQSEEPPSIFGWKNMPVRKMNPSKRIQRERVPLCTPESCATKCADRGFASCHSVCNPSAKDNNCSCLCPFGSPITNATTQ